jgi:hypothetical protein
MKFNAWLESKNREENGFVENISEGEELKHYMFFSNLMVIKRKVEELLSMDRHELDAMLSDGHDWASDHIATSKDDIEEVHGWATSRGGEV